MNKLLPYCIDINSEFCPCLLAETNHCVFCSHLHGEINCNCNWTGSCIFYEKQWQDKNGSTYKPVRQDAVGTVVGKKSIGNQTFLLEVEVSAEWAKELDKAGAYVFLKRSEDAAYASFPVGVMSVEGTIISMVIESVGPKSARVLADNITNLTVRGPYANGTFGQPWIDNTKDSKVLLISGGIGQPPAMPIARRLVANGNSVTAILAPGKVGKCFIASWLEEMGCRVIQVPSMRLQGMPLLRELVDSTAERPALIVSAGPDDQHYGVITVMQAAGVNLPMAATNNATMCCGEGICGSCEKILHDNKKQDLCTCFHMKEAMSEKLHKPSKNT